MVRILISYPDIARKIKNVARYAQNYDLSVTEKTRRSIEHLGMLAVYCLIMTYSVGKLVKRLPRNQMRAMVEVLDGLEPGEKYVTKGGFTLKAELQKEQFGDGHGH